MLAYALTFADEKPDATSRFYTRVRDFLIPEAWVGLWMTYPFLGLLAYPPQAQILPAALIDLTLTAAPGVGVVGVLSAAPSGAQVIKNWWVIITSSPSGQSYVMRITDHAASSANVTLDAVPEQLTNQVVTLAQMELTLATDTGVLADGIWTSGGGVEMQLVKLHDEESVKTEYPGLPQESWPPDRAARVGMTTVRLSHYDRKPHRIEIPYYRELADPTGALAIPKYLVPALAEKALALTLQAKGDGRQRTADARYADWISKAKDYEHLLRVGHGSQGQQRRDPPY